MKRYLFCYGIYGLLLVGLAVVIGLLLAADPGVTAAWIRENGPVETLSAAGYGLALVLFAVLRRGVKSYPWFLLMLLAMGLRELDFHARWTTMTTTSTRFYVSPDVPLLEKIIALTVLAVLLYGFFRLIRSHGAGLMSGLRAGRPVEVGFLLGVALAVVAKLLDGLSRKMAGLGIIMSEASIDAAECVEEVLELGIPLMFIVAIIIAARTRSAGHPPPE
ncbi:MAG: hypothetical protein ACLFPD_05760 [Desulfosudaceae bacterium]